MRRSKIGRFVRKILIGLSAGSSVGNISEPHRLEVARREATLLWQSVPTSTLFNLAVLSLMTASVWNSVPLLPYMVWLGCSFVILGLWVLAWVKADPQHDTSLKSVRIKGGILSGLATLRGASWGIGIAVFFPMTGPEQQLVLGLTFAGMMAGGAFGLLGLPVASYGFALSMAVGSALALLQAGGGASGAMVALIVAYFFYLAAMVRKQHQVMIDQMLSEFKGQEQGETIGLLLREFEKSSSDWLWQTDRRGRFVNVGERFADAAGIARAKLEGMRFDTFFNADPEVLNLYACESLRRREALYELFTRVGDDDAPRYWRISGHPQFGPNGRFEGFRGVAADLTEQVMAERQLKHLAHSDPLTGLNNRARFSDALTDAFATRLPEQIGLLAMDLNGFKIINDTLGHATGDGLLAQLGERLTQWAGSKRMVARLGGDEFAVLFDPEEEPGGVEQLAADLLAQFDAPFQVGLHELRVDGCAGVARAGCPAANADDLMRYADLALYAAKADGRRSWRLFERDMGTALMRRQVLEVALRQAVDRREFTLRYQPLIDTKSAAVTGYEALIRWSSPELGQVGPDEFIPIAEESGLIVPIGDWVLGEALARATACPVQAGIAVNVSPVQLYHRGFVDSVREHLAAAKVAPERLTIEITEGVLLEATPQTRETLDELVALGVKIALDDFGAGYSSLSYLREFPFSKIKIDKAFVSSIEDNATNVHIVRAVVGLAAGLGFEVVAEGVETHTQLAKLTTLGVDQVQGFLFAAPMSSPGAAFAEVQDAIAKSA